MDMLAEILMDFMGYMKDLVLVKESRGKDAIRIVRCKTLMHRQHMV